MLEGVTPAGETTRRGKLSLGIPDDPATFFPFNILLLLSEGHISATFPPALSSFLQALGLIQHQILPLTSKGAK